MGREITLIRPVHAVILTATIFAAAAEWRAKEISAEAVSAPPTPTIENPVAFSDPAPTIPVFQLPANLPPEAKAIMSEPHLDGWRADLQSGKSDTQVFFRHQPGSKFENPKFSSVSARVLPTMESIILEEPDVVKKGGVINTDLLVLVDDPKGLFDIWAFSISKNPKRPHLPVFYPVDVANVSHLQRAKQVQGREFRDIRWEPLPSRIPLFD